MIEETQSKHNQRKQYWTTKKQFSPCNTFTGHPFISLMFYLNQIEDVWISNDTLGDFGPHILTKSYIDFAVDCELMLIPL